MKSIYKASFFVLLVIVALAVTSSLVLAQTAERPIQARDQMQDRLLDQTRDRYFMQDRLLSQIQDQERLRDRLHIHDASSSDPVGMPAGAMVGPPEGTAVPNQNGPGPGMQNGAGPGMQNGVCGVCNGTGMPDGGAAGHMHGSH